ncbi:YphA family membrane protein [Bacillus sp. JJ1562]|uniref:YphA family membrane protein n=1 Tax=Bacillus sp. JJ1562 TaxID=3122960 RepID=UPI003002670C
MEGAIFYWICWMAWVCSTFLMKKNKERLFLSILFLMTIILSPYYVVIGDIKINCSILVIISYCLREISNRPKKQLLYLLICILTISLAYCSFLLFELFDPVWLLFNRNLMLGAVLIYVTIMLLKDFRLRLAGLLIGAIQGDILFGIIINNVNFPYEVGSFVFLDVISISFGFIFVWSSLEILLHHFDVMVQKNTKEKLG